MRYWTRRPGTAAVAILSLALGLGAATTVFAALWSVVLRPLPYHEPDHLVAVHARLAEVPLARLNPSPLDFSELRAHHELFSEVGAYQFMDYTRTGIERAEKVNAIAVTRSLLDVLDVKPVLGRLFQPDETPSVVISERYWESDFGRDPAILGRTLQLDGKAYPVIGVMPSWFAFPNEVTQMWVPLTFRPTQLLDGKGYYLRTLARLRPGLEFTDASEAMDSLSRGIARTAPAYLPRSRPGWTLFLAPMGADEDGSRRHWIGILCGVATFLWAIVCWNFGSLLLVRWTDQKFEVAVRKTLGATRGSLVWPVLREVLALTAISGIGGALLAQGGVSLMSRYGRVGTVRMDWEVYWFCAGLSLLTAILAALYPASRVTGELNVEALREAGHQHTQGLGTRRWQQGLIVAQVAAATVMLVAGGLFTRSLISLLQVPLGFDAHNVTTLETNLPKDRYDEPFKRKLFYDQMVEKVRLLPGVTAVSGCTLLPFGYGENINVFSIDGQPEPKVKPFADINMVLPGYFNAMRIPLLSGRVLSEQDRDKPVVVIDDTLAQRFFAGENPIGRKLRMPWGDSGARKQGAASETSVYEVVGVAASVKNSSLDLAPAPEIYFPAASNILQFTTVIRTDQPSPEISKLVTEIVYGIDSDQPIYNIFPEEEFVARSLKTRRFVVWLAGAFAAIGTGLASLGVFNLLSYTVQMKRREIGIRMAIGASGRRIAYWICRSGVVLVLAGLVIGTIASIAGQNLVRSQLYGIGFAEPSVWIGVMGIVGGMGLLACALPAWRAARVNPADSLKDSV